MPTPKTNTRKRHRKTSKQPTGPDTHVVLVDIPKYFILGGLILLLSTLIWIISPFIPSIIIGSVIAVGFYPIHRRIYKRVGKRRTVASLISTAIILAIIFIPVSWFVSYITDEAVDTYVYVESEVSTLLEADANLIPKILKDSFMGTVLEQAKAIVPIKAEDVFEFGTSMLQNISQFLVNQTTNIAKQLSIAVLYAFIMFMSTFFFLRDGDRFVQEVKDLIPLAEKYRNTIVEKLRSMSRGILYGLFGAAMFQGFLGGVGFAMAGIENAVFWGTIMAFFAIVPYVGSTLIWFPAVIILATTGHWVSALFLFLWGTFVVSTVDNLIKPIVIGESARIHPLLSFLTIIGGVLTMGLPGLIIAPYLLSLALTFLHIYKLEYRSVLDH